MESTGRFGIDTLAVSVPLDRDWICPRPVKIPGGGWLKSRYGRVWIEASLPRRLGPDNLDLVSGDDAFGVLEGLLRSAERVAPLADVPWETVPIERIDIAANVNDENRVFSSYFLAMARSQPSHIVPTVSFVEGEASTLNIGRKTSWKVVAYDKYRESGNDRAEGCVRVEVRVLKQPLQKAKWVGDDARVVCPADIDDKRVGVLYERTISRSGMDLGVRDVDSRSIVGINWSTLQLESYHI